MINAKGNLIGSINSKQELIGTLNKAVEYIDPVTQEKEITPSKEIQIIEPDRAFTGLSKVTVNPIPDEYIIPSGEIKINANGNYNVTDKASAKVNVPIKTLGTKTIIKNGVYNATDDNLDGYSQVEVETSGVDINDYFYSEVNANRNLSYYIKKIPMINTSQYITMYNMFSGFHSLITIPEINTSKVVNMGSMFSACSSLQEIPMIDTSNVTDMAYMFNNCSSLINIPQLNTSKVTSMAYMFYNCNSLQTIPLIDTSNVNTMSNMIFYCNSLLEIPKINTSNVTDMSSAIRNCDKLTTIPQLDAGKVERIIGNFASLFALQNFGGLLNIGQAYSITASNNYSLYKYDLSSCQKLTHDSLMNVINNLYDIATKGVKTQQLVLGNTNLAKLTTEEVAIGTSKGWSIS